MSRPEDDGFLSRWSRRKQAIAKGEAPVEPAAPEAEAEAPAVAAPEAELPLPSLDDVLPGGDVSAFLQKHVPDSLRNLALRKAWENDPVISGFIEMADYQLDYSNPDSIPGWSSTLEGVDVKKFVDALFKNMPDPQAEEPVQPETDAESSPEPAQISQNPNDEFIITNYEDSEIAANLGSDTESEGRKTSENLHIAVQNNPEESSGYLRQKKRHGGALPS
jgi:Protein of unknown function (DUF3306)